MFGGAKRSRTADLLNAIQALYQLSYSPEGVVRMKRRNLKKGVRAIKPAP